MSTKEWVSFYSDGASLYQEGFYDFTQHELNPNPAVIQIDNPNSFSITQKEHVDNESLFQLVVEIPAERFDDIAVAWCKKRCLNPNKYTLEELLNKFNFEWPISKNDLLNGLEDALGDCELTEFVEARMNQEELSFDNIFDVVTEDKSAALNLKAESDELIKQRENSELQEKLKISKIAGAARGILSHIKANHSISDEESMLQAIERALEDITSTNNDKS